MRGLEPGAVPIKQEFPLNASPPDMPLLTELGYSDAWLL
jgi:hypothetical protein